MIISINTDLGHYFLHLTINISSQVICHMLDREPKRSNHEILGFGEDSKDRQPG